MDAQAGVRTALIGVMGEGMGYGNLTKGAGAAADGDAPTVPLSDTGRAGGLHCGDDATLPIEGRGTPHKEARFDIVLRVISVNTDATIE